MSPAPEGVEPDSPQVIECTAQIVGAYASHNQLALDQIGNFIKSVYLQASALSNGEVPRDSSDPGQPAVAIKKSITDDWIICLEDGKKFKTLKRYLRRFYGMSPEQYRARWGLPGDYPMVAPSYARHRSNLAKQIGLGRKSKGRPPAPRGGRR